MRQKAPENLQTRSNKQTYRVQNLDFLKNFPIFLKQKPTTTCCKVCFFKYLRKASSKTIIGNRPNTRPWIPRKWGYLSLLGIFSTQILRNVMVILNWPTETLENYILLPIHIQSFSWLHLPSNFTEISYSFVEFYDILISKMMDIIMNCFSQIES